MAHPLISDHLAFDLDAYLSRIGYTGPRTATPDVLRDLHLRHTLAIPFENLNPLLGWPVRLDTASIVRKLVSDRRGGYCFEQNLLFAHALHALGFQFRGLAARVVYNAPAGAITPRSHMLLEVAIGGETMLADVGFGGLTLTGPLAMRPGIEQFTPHEPFRVTAAEDGVHNMDARLGGAWTTLYRFTLETTYLADYEVTSWYLCHAPGSRFTSSLMAARPIQGGRYALRNNVLTRYSASAVSERRILQSAEALRGALEQELGLRLPESPELDAALERIAAADSDSPALP